MFLVLIFYLIISFRPLLFRCSISVLIHDLLLVFILSLHHVLFIDSISYFVLVDESEFEAVEAEKEPSEGGGEPAVDDEITIATDEAVPAEDNVSDTPSVEVITQDDLDLARSDVEGDDLDLKAPEEAHDSESASSVEVITQDDLDRARSDIAAADDLEAGAEAEAATDAVRDGIEPASETVTEMIAVPVMTELPPSGALNLRRRHLSNSDSSGRKHFFSTSACKVPFH